jgi:hypothetical protein
MRGEGIRRKQKMARLRLQSFRWIPSSGILHFTVLLIFVFLSEGLASAAAPPTGENAYCGKGDVAQFGEKDGPAELPKTCYYTGLDGTPSPGKQIRVAAKEDLTEAINSAKCGDTLFLPAGATYEVASLPSKKCDDRHYITIRTDTPDSKLPPESTRISPAWAGIASLPGRPAFAQPPGGAAKLMATLEVKDPSGAVVGDHLRFIGIEWTSRADANIMRLISTEHSDHIIFDRNYIHPAEGTELAHGIGMVEGARFIGVINSYVSGFNCIARSGKCTDATAVGGAHSDAPFGTFKIYNNFLEASGENILFGGASSKNNPTDIEIRRNHFFRPMIWKEGEPGYTPSPKGDPYIVKNHFELKSAIRVLVEANLLENSWGGFSQRGFSMALSARSQASNCPICRVNDITLRYNRIRNVAGVFQISNSRATKGKGIAADGGIYSIHDIVADDIHEEDYRGGGVFLVLLSAAPPVHDVQIDHVTSFGPGVLASIMVKGDADKLKNFTIANSVFKVGSGRRPPIAAAGGGKDSCAPRSQRLGAAALLDACFDPYRFDHNLIITDDKGGWPKGNMIVSSAEAAGIRELKGTISKNPRLCHEKEQGCQGKSPGAGAASDGRDVGADVDGVEAAIAGVE